MANPDFTITVTVDTTTTPHSLVYSGAGPGGSTTSAKSHKVFRRCDLFFTSPDGDLLIQFKGPKKPFQSPNNAVGVLVTAAMGATTPKLTTKNSTWGPKIKYTAAVALPAGPPFMLAEDPELEDGGGPGGGGKRKKKTAKKVSKKKAKKK
jgi:hypothetical protein